jgi:hypothetical protein
VVSVDPVGAKVRDLIVVLPGITGSTLADKNGRMVWAPTPGAIVGAIRSFGQSVKTLALPSALGDEHPGDGVTPISLMPDLHVLPGIWSAHIGYGLLLDTLRRRLRLNPYDANAETPGNLLPVPYDWRLSNRYNGRRLKAIVEPVLERWRRQGPEFEDAKLVFICHSMGGLVARWYVQQEGGAELTRKIVTLGTPHRGAARSLEQLVNGVHKRLGPLSVDLTMFARTLPSMHQLLPEYACIETAGALSKTTELTVPELDVGMVADGMRFYDQLNSAPAVGYDLHAVVGFRQSTGTTARVTGSRIELLTTIEGSDEGGDATVPRLSAAPKGLDPDDPTIVTVVDQHGALQSNAFVLDLLEGALTAAHIRRRAAAPIAVAVAADELVFAGEPIAVTARPLEHHRIALRVDAIDEVGATVATIQLQQREDFTGALPGLPPGMYRIVFGGVGPVAAQVSPVTRPVLVWDRP